MPWSHSEKVNINSESRKREKRNTRGEAICQGLVHWRKLAESNQQVIRPIFTSITAKEVVKSYQASAQSCHLREVDLCVATMIFHYQGSGIPEDEPGVEQFCEALQETIQCIHNFTNKCMTPVQREVLELVAEGSMKTVNDFCTQGSELRAKYLKHAKCLADVHAEDAMRDCMTDMQVTIESTTTAKFDKRVGTMCCGFRRFLDCGEQLTLDKCGSEAVEMGRTMAELAVTELPNVVCGSFDPNSNQCKSLLPPVGTTPKGTASSSQLARLLATALGS